MKFLGTLSLFWAALIAAQNASANSIVSVRSAYDSQDPYEVVYASDKSETQERPGIYALVRGKRRRGTPRARPCSGCLTGV
ncbi:MAG: hypothetical protein HC902_02160 [Calothrix sp. SM1_5_4]|nr:hypothetical protein [Calothrix sp. SM1_5_4]